MRFFVNKFIGFFVLSAVLLLSCNLFANSVITDEKNDVIDARKEEVLPVIILGGGVGGLTSAVYLARAGATPVLIEGPMPGGLITQSHLVQNWPGETNISGFEISEKLREQALANGCKIFSEEVIKIDFSKTPFEITSKELFSNKTITRKALSCIIAMGTTSNKLGVAGEKDFWGKGISNCAVCDGALYKNKEVAVIGGRDSAIEEALYLSNLAQKVHVILRKDSFFTRDEKKKNELLKKANVQIHYNNYINRIEGNNEKLTHLILKDVFSNNFSQISLDGIFLAIGSKPNTSMLNGQIELDGNGYVILKKGQQTSLEGVYAVGDIADPIYKQAVSAAGDAAKAAIDVQKYLENIYPNGFNISLTSEKIVLKPLIEEEISAFEITSEAQLKEELLNAKIPVLIDFYATWCPPCQRIKPSFENCAKILDGKIKFLKINVDKVAALATYYKVSSMPTLLIIEDGRVIARKIGAPEIFKTIDSLKNKKDKAFFDKTDF